MGMTASPSGPCSGDPVTGAPARTFSIFDDSESISRAHSGDAQPQSPGPARVDVLGADGSL